ncbi:hypothetical protein ACRRTK_012850 [Alexandromys fortis]
MEDEENSIKVLTKLKQSLEYNLYQQQKKNDELQKEITRYPLSTCSAITHKHRHNEEISIAAISAVYGKSSMEKNPTEGIMKRSQKSTRHRRVEKTGDQMAIVSMLSNADYGDFFPWVLTTGVFMGIISLSCRKGHLKDKLDPDTEGLTESKNVVDTFSP